MPVWIGPAVKWGLVLALVLTGWALLRWVLKRAEDRQAYLDTIAGLERERQEDARKLAAAQAAEEVRHAARRDSVSGLPTDLGLQSRTKPDQRAVGEPPAG